MSDETPEIETTDTDDFEQDVGTEGSDSLTAEADTEDEGATTDSPSALEHDGSEKGPVPYGRFKEKVDQFNELKQQYDQLLANSYQSLASQRTEPQQVEPVFDEDTDKRLEKWYAMRKQADPDFVMTRQMREDWERFQLKQRNPDYDELEPKIKELKQKMATGSISSQEAEQLVIDGLRYRSGKPMQKAAQEAINRQSAKNRAAGPQSSPTPAGDPPPPDYDEMPDDEFRKLVDSVLRS